MSWECEKCHVLATGKTHAEAGHFYGGSRGLCETCHQGANCADCRCQGDWGEAYRKSGKMTEQRQVAELLDILDDTNDT